MTREQMIEILLRGGVNLDTFDPWRLGKLYGEICNREVVLALDANGKPRRFARSVKVEIYYRPDENAQVLELIEVRRILPDGTVIEKEKPWGLSETRRREERTIDAVVRGLWEEFKIPKRFVRLRRLLAPLALVSDELRESHPSSIYPGVISTVIYTEWSYRMLHRFYKPQGYVAVEDGGMEVHSEWRPRGIAPRWLMSR